MKLDINIFLKQNSVNIFTFYAKNEKKSTLENILAADVR